MKNRTLSALLCAFLALAQSRGQIVIESIDSSDGQSTIALNVNLDSSGGASTPSPWFTVSGSVYTPGAFGGIIGITMDAIKNVSTDEATRGDKLTDGTFDRDDSGYMGVQNNPNGGGIGTDASNREGIALLFDELTSIDPFQTVQITGINIQNVGRSGTDPVGDESFFIVNPATREYIEFIPESGTAGTFDVSSLNLSRSGGESGPVAVLYSGDVGGFRLYGLTVEITSSVPVPPIVRLFSATSQEVEAGEGTTLRWNIYDAESITIEPDIGDVTSITTNGLGSIGIFPSESTIYTLTTANPQGSTQRSVFIHVADAEKIPEGACGENGISYLAGSFWTHSTNTMSLRAGDSEILSGIQLVVEKQGQVLSSDVEVDTLVDGYTFVTGSDMNPGMLPKGVSLNSYYLHADLPDDAPASVLTGTITFEGHIVGLAHCTQTAPASGYANRMEETDAVFALEDMLFEEESLSAESYKRRSGNSEVVDEIYIAPDGHTLKATFRLNGSDPANIDDLRIITLDEAPETNAVSPNILIFLADDMGMGDTSAYQDWTGVPDNSQLYTPTMERLADVGIRFTDAHVQNRCTPTRYALMTGRYAWRAGLLEGVAFGVQVDPLIEKQRPTLPGFLKEHGYNTGMVGKWHIGLSYRQTSGEVADGWDDADLLMPMADGPIDHGFNYFYGESRSHKTSGPDGMEGNTSSQSIGPGWLRYDRITGATGNGKELDGSYVLNDMGQVLYDHAIEFMDDHLGNATLSQQPFMLYFSSPANHSPYTPNDFINGIPVTGASQWKNGTLTGEARRDFIYMNDVLLEQLITYLETTDDPRNPGAKLIDNTLVIFSSDNGAEINEVAATGNLRSYKAHIYEGGHRVPFIAYWKNGGIGDNSEGDGGLSTSASLGLQDLYPTIAEIIGHPLAAPENGMDACVDGFCRRISLEGGTEPPRPALITNEEEGKIWLSLQFNGTIPVDPPQTGYWKVVYNNTLLANAATHTATATPIELYELLSDRTESNNLFNEPEYASLIDWFSSLAEHYVNNDIIRSRLPEAPLSINGMQNGILSMEVPVAPYFVYDVQQSSNLTNWTSIREYQSASDDLLQIGSGMDDEQKFFRVVPRQ
ncbi:MAG: sulfatase-like hydrolase/transferase [Pontiellaceae bacterium]|nr:sulfatase-like hydrolase/transferase [Pontiellaceae bacterium]